MEVTLSTKTESYRIKQGTSTYWVDRVLIHGDNSVKYSIESIYDEILIIGDSKRKKIIEELEIWRKKNGLS